MGDHRSPLWSSFSRRPSCCWTQFGLIIKTGNLSFPEYLSHLKGAILAACWCVVHFVCRNPLRKQWTFQFFGSLLPFVWAAFVDVVIFVFISSNSAGDAKDFSFISHHNRSFWTRWVFFLKVPFAADSFYGKVLGQVLHLNEITKPTMDTSKPYFKAQYSFVSFPIQNTFNLVKHNDPWFINAFCRTFYLVW